MNSTPPAGGRKRPASRKKSRRTPYEEIVELSSLPQEVKGFLPRRWEKYGDVVVLKLPRELKSYEREVGELYAKVLGAKLVLVDEGGVRGLTRYPVVKMIYGEQREAFHKENRLIYNFDPMKIMFSSGNIDERRRPAELIGERGRITWVVWDLFAGIGYFTLPAGRAAVKGKVVSVEINPLAYYYLIKNLVFNDLAYRVIPVLGDSSKIVIPGTADMVVSGYFVEEGYEDHIKRLCALLKPEGGWILYHFLAKKKEREMKASVILKEFSKWLRERDLRIVYNICRKVKSYAPLVYHYVLELQALPPGES